MSKLKLIPFLLFLVLTLFYSQTFAYVSLYKEEILGKKILLSFPLDKTLVNDPEIEGYSNFLARYIAEKNLEIYFPFMPQVFTINSPVFNAYSFPGGYIFLNLKVLADAKNEGELAGILSHEMGHLLHRDVIKNMEVLQRYQITDLVLMLGALLLGGPQAAYITGSLSTGLSELKFLSFTREEERNADKTGLKLMTQAGYSPSDMIQLFIFLIKKEPQIFNDYKYLLTHPLSWERIGYLKMLVKNLPERKYKHYLLASPEYFRALKIKAEIKIGLDFSPSFSDYEEDKGKNSSKPELFWKFYKKSVHLSQNFLYKKAFKILTKLEMYEKPENKVFLWIDKIRLLILLEKYKEAQNLAENLLKNKELFPFERFYVEYLKGVSLYKLGRYKEAYQVFKALYERGLFLTSPKFYFHLAKVSYFLNKKGESDFYFARFWELCGEKNLSLYYFKLALQKLNKMSKIYLEAKREYQILSSL